jgi:hypothetical protein
MNNYELCVWYSETKTIEAPNATAAKKIACEEGWKQHGSLGGVYAVEIIKINDTWTDPDTWSYSAVGSD